MTVDAALSRRSFLIASGAAAAAATVATTGTASGDPLPDGVLLWTRVTTPQPAATVGWQVATDTGFGTVAAPEPSSRDPNATTPSRSTRASRA
jgi:alkaline phosphatase D